MYFSVIGRGRFPVDMLRYDRAFPVDTTSAERILSDSSDQKSRRLRIVYLQSADRHDPTVGRWESFGWTVAAIRKDLADCRSATTAKFDDE